MLIILPTLVAHDVGHPGLGHSELDRQLFLSEQSARISSSHLFNLAKRQPCVPVLFTVLNAAFLSHIFGVFCRRTKEQMLRTYACRVVARVANEKARRNIVDQQKRKTMSIYPTLFSILNNAKITVTSFIFRPGPYPTRFGFFNLAPKSIHAHLIYHITSQVKMGGY